MVATGLRNQLQQLRLLRGCGPRSRGETVFAMECRPGHITLSICRTPNGATNWHILNICTVLCNCVLIVYHALMVGHGRLAHPTFCFSLVFVYIRCKRTGCPGRDTETLDQTVTPRCVSTTLLCMGVCARDGGIFPRSRIGFSDAWVR